MVSEKSKNEDKDLENKKVNLENQEDQEEIFELLDNAQQEIEAIADKETDNDEEELTKRLLALGADKEDIARVVARTKKQDDTIKETKRETLDKFYSENFQHLGKSVLAELRMRPIYRKYIKLDKKNFWIYLREERRKKKNPDADMSDLDQYGIRDSQIEGAGSIFIAAEGYKEIPEFVKKYKYNETNLKDIKTYQDNLRYRRESLQETFSALVHYEKPHEILTRLYAIQLNQIREKLKNNDSNLKENFDVYFRPGVEKYVNYKSHSVFSKKNADLKRVYHTTSIADRIESFVKAVEKDKIVLSDAQKSILRKEVVSIFENSKEDLSRNMQDYKRGDLQSFIDLCDFSEEQKKALNANLFNLMLENKQNPLDCVFDNPDFPYTEAQLEKVFNIVKHAGIDENGMKVYNFTAIDKQDHYWTVKIEGILKFPFSDSQKEQLGEMIFESVLKKLKDKAGEGDLEYIMSFSVRENTSDGWTFNQSQLQTLQETTKMLFLKTAENYIEKWKHNYELMSIALSNAGLESLHKTSISITSSLIQKLETLREDKEKKHPLMEKIPWGNDIEKMLHVQKRSRRAQYDPWITDIDPLIDASLKSGLLSLDNQKDGALLLEYTKKVGAKNLPEYFKLFAEIKRSDSVETMSQELKERIKTNFSIDVDEVCQKDPRNLNLIINDLEKIRLTVASQLIREDIESISQAASYKYGQEFINSIIGNSGFSHGGGTVQEKLNTYQKRLTENPELFKLSDGYETASIEVSEFAEVALDDKEKQKQMDGVLNNIDLKNYYAKIIKPIKLLNEKREITEILRIHNISIGEEFKSEIRIIEAIIQGENNKKDKNEKAIINLENRRSALQTQANEFSALSGKNFGKDLAKIMEKYAVLIPDGFKSKQEFMLDLSLQDMASKFKEQIEPLKNQNVFGDSVTIGNISSLAEFIRGHVGEHYLNKKHGEGQAITIEDKNTLKYLRKIWGTQDFENTILSISEKKINAFEKSDLTGKKKSITMIPSKGMQRIFSGDLGGACTSSKDTLLAKGEFPGITSYSFVLDEGTPAQRFAGSFLVVETETEDGKPMLVLRANNPAQNLGNMVDTDELIQKTINEVKNIAIRRGISLVGVVHDRAHAASSNRTFVADYYQKKFKRENAVQLKETEETKFNNYPIFNKNGNNPVVIV